MYSSGTNTYTYAQAHSNGTASTAKAKLGPDVQHLVAKLCSAVSLLNMYGVFVSMLRPASAYVYAKRDEQFRWNMVKY